MLRDSTAFSCPSRFPFPSGFQSSASCGGLVFWFCSCGVHSAENAWQPPQIGPSAQGLTQMSREQQRGAARNAAKIKRIPRDAARRSARRRYSFPSRAAALVSRKRPGGELAKEHPELKGEAGRGKVLRLLARRRARLRFPHLCRRNLSQVSTRKGPRAISTFMNANGEDLRSCAAFRSQALCNQWLARCCPSVANAEHFLDIRRPRWKRDSRDALRARP